MSDFPVRGTDFAFSRDISQSQRDALSFLKDALFEKDVFNIAKHPDAFVHFVESVKEKQKDASSRKPLVLFGIDENSLSEQDGGKSFDPNTYFDGHGDDIGALWHGATALQLPSRGLSQIFPGVLKEQRDPDGTVRHIKIYQETEEDIKRMERITPDTKYAAIPENIFSHRESYFHLLVLCHIIMKEIAESL